MYTYDYSKLKGRICEICGNQQKFSEGISLSTASLSKKLNNKRRWTQDEIDRAIVVLDIKSEEIANYFFTHYVQNT